LLTTLGETLIFPREIIIMKYEVDYDSWNIAKDVIAKLKFDHIRLDCIVFLKSRGSKSRRILARIHGLPKIMQIALNTKAFYAIELISENFDRLDHNERTKTIIHELMHIPACFGGGFRQHGNYVTSKNVEKAFRCYLESRNGP
jgi:predicted metallopeptidase